MQGYDYLCLPLKLARCPQSLQQLKSAETLPEDLQPQLQSVLQQVLIGCWH